HSSKVKTPKGDLLLESRAGALKGGKRGAAVVPGEPDKSLLLRAVRHAGKDLQMPPSGKLPDHEIAIFEEWIRRGLPFPEAAAAPAVGLAEGRKFWSFQPVREQPVPQVKDRSWPRQRLDAFILADLEKRGFGPSPTAARRTLIRRASFDLIG